ncbi:hypothetical protein BDV32DRAFT_150629 [Aspergillus pseudonomiae]|uniref:Uncharacterized protein n=1 Tax=Aspergillus pseudonomiae TaxID=1506151 RepID=A0A5N6HZI8_9EURO|nr:uncharacterized protein BDV37DRAFT_282289 [Aspergillus pseudonomiae]KAB8259304.1 hypothetical protein BDV32DRAFT_150629 [Aspergillus pseudonomiae]KAE8405055.1 hypothetical protein BDV37DRAFT_282289 [Aspergillus pseudonomiae]
MQIPFRGTEFASPEVRARQASLDLPSAALEHYTCCQTLKDIGSEHTPTLIGSKKKAQGQDSWAPGGYLFYIAFSKVPGVRIQLGVIGALAKSGVLPSWYAQGELYWDERTGKLYIAGPFELSTDPWEWEADLWEDWYLDEGEVTQKKSVM